MLGKVIIRHQWKVRGVTTLILLDELSVQTGTLQGAA